MFVFMIARSFSCFNSIYFTTTTTTTTVLEGKLKENNKKKKRISHISLLLIQFIERSNTETKQNKTTKK